MMLKSITFITICGLISSVTAPSADISLHCDPCERRGQRIVTRVGKDLAVTYMTNRPLYQLLIIKFNGTRNVIHMVPKRVNTKKVKDRRFSYSTISVGGFYRGITITLRNVTRNDGGLKFYHEYLDQNLEHDHATYTLEIWSEDKDKAHASSLINFSTLSVICVVLAILVIVAIIILICLCVSGNLCTCCRNRRRRRDKRVKRIASFDEIGDVREPIFATSTKESNWPIHATPAKESNRPIYPTATKMLNKPINATSTKEPHRPIYVTSANESNMPIYATSDKVSNKPRENAKTEYAGLGTGGERIDKPKPAPTQSTQPTQSRPKTDDVNYPGLSITYLPKGVKFIDKH